MAKKSQTSPELELKKKYILRATSSAKHVEGEFISDGRTAKLLIEKGFAELVSESE